MHRVFIEYKIMNYIRKTYAHGIAISSKERPKDFQEEN